MCRNYKNHWRGAKYGNDTVTFNSLGTGQLKNVQKNFSDNIINYGNVNDKVFNWENTEHIGKKLYIRTKDQYDYNSLAQKNTII